MKKRFVILFLLILSIFKGHSQFYEDFSSQDFATNNWQGMLSFFQFTSSTAIPAEMRPALQLYDNVANTSYICAPYNFAFTDSVEWSFWVKLSFTPSVNNHARVYIVSDQLDVSGNLNGYFVGIGETNKKITLSKQQGATITTLITGTVTDMSASTNAVRVKVIRYSDGLWKLSADPMGGSAFVPEGTANDLTFTSSLWHGLYCKYTVSNATKIYFDEFYTGSVIADTIKPFVSNVQTVSPFQLNVTFSEVVKLSDALNSSNYTADCSIGSPIDILQDGTNPRLFYLSFSVPFPDNQICTLTVDNISDMSGNIMDTQYIPFAYYIAQPYDVVINEIMADPTPVVNLPEFEYLELFNRTNMPISINNWKLFFGTTQKTFANVAIPPGGHLIVCGASAAGPLSAYGTVYDMGSISITNDGQTITLVDDLNRLIHTVSFTIAWYQDTYKDDGGWSLEMIDPDNPCGGMSNWKASANVNGGTPGTVNSVKSSNPDLIPPEMIRISKIDDQTIRVWFSEPMDSTGLLNPAAYSFSHGLTLQAAPKPVYPQYSSVILYLSQAMQQTVIYTLTIQDTLTDCTGNMLPLSSDVRFAQSQPLEAGDIIINEVLSNPPTGLNEFVEIYNHSDKILDLKEMNLANIDANTGNVASVKPISADGFLMFPGDHIVLSKNVEGIKSYYYCPYPNNFIQMESLPTYTNDKGNVVLVHVGGTVIDRFDYDVSMHFPLLQSTKGVSFERINYSRPTNDPTNWHSASETAGFATPGYVNSQYSESVFDGEITIDPEIFSPDNDGYNDIVNISYKFTQPGNVGTITIFDSRGRIMRNLVTSELLGIEGVYSWDGVTNDYQKAGIGIYVILFETFDIQGNKKAWKKTVVVGAMLNR
jgi:hypothetical protein